MNKKLYRSARQNVLAGVCGGIAEYFDIDVTLVRLGWVVLFFLQGIGILLYIIAAIIIPRQPGYSDGSAEPGVNGQEGNSSYRGEVPGRSNAVLVIGLVMIGFGGLMLLNRIFPGWNILRELKILGWPLILILIGVAVIYSSVRKR